MAKTRQYLEVPVTFGTQAERVGWLTLKRLVAGVLEEPDLYRFAPAFQLIDGQLQLYEVSILPVASESAADDSTPVARTFID